MSGHPHQFLALSDRDGWFFFSVLLSWDGLCLLELCLLLVGGCVVSLCLLILCATLLWSNSLVGIRAFLLSELLVIGGSLLFVPALV